jgi:hypothetical protein
MPTNIQKTTVIFFYCLFSLTTFAQQSDQPRQLKGFDQFMQQALKDWNTPGACVGIVVKSSKE